MKKSKRISRLLIALALATSMLLGGCTESESSSSKTSNSTAETTAISITTTAPPATTEPTVTTSSTPVDPQNHRDITPMMWEVKSQGGAKIYMLGSMHALNEEVYPLPDEILNAYNESDSLAVECDVISFQANFEAQMQMMNDMKYPTGKTIKDDIGEDLYNKLVALLKSKSMYMSMYDGYKPVFWMSLIENQLAIDAKLNSTKGFDMYILDKAHKDGKNVIEVETAQFQTEMLASFSLELYKLQLEVYVNDYDAQVASMTDLYEAWCNGTVDKVILEESVDETQYTAEQKAALEDYNKKMLTDRNVGMKNKLVEMLKNNQKVFYVVGAAHFVGEGGIIDLLEKDGYTVTAVTYASQN